MKLMYNNEELLMRLSASATMTPATLTVSGWSETEKTQAVTVDGIAADETKQLIIPAPAIAIQDEYYSTGVKLASQGDGNLTFTCETIPANDLTVYIWVFDSSPATGVGGGGASLPSGSIIMWNGTAENVPDGWALCDGENGTPDLRDKFVLGAGVSHAVGSTGGQEEVTLTLEQMPSHNHRIDRKGATGQLYTNSGQVYPSIGNNEIQYNMVSGDPVFMTSSKGGNQPHPNMPPYYALCYIMKL